MRSDRAALAACLAPSACATPAVHRDGHAAASCALEDVAHLTSARGVTSVACTLSPSAAVLAAAAVAPGVIAGTFEMTVRATGVIDDILYLNAEADYRDQRGISIDVPYAVQAALRARWGADPAEYLAGKRIRLRGRAARTKIILSADGVMTDKYYYQTHVALHDADRIELLGPR